MMPDTNSASQQIMSLRRPAGQPPPKAIAVKSSYVEDIAHIEFRTPMPPFKLRSKFYKNEEVDIAMLESSINGIKGADFFRQSYFPLSNLLDCRNGFNSMLEDVFVICGFPTAKITMIAENKTEHSLLVHFVTGEEGDKHSLSTRYTLHYSSKHPEPAGLSGSPVWLLRDSNNLGAPLDLGKNCQLIERDDPIMINMTFAGMVVSHVPDEEVVQVVRPEVCALFAAKGYETLPTLRDPREDAQIAEEFDFWLERYASRFDNVRL